MFIKRVKDDFKEEYDSLMVKKSQLDEEKNGAYELAKREIDSRFQERENTIDKLLDLVTFDEEVPDEEPMEPIEVESCQTSIEDSDQLEDCSPQPLSEILPESPKIIP